MAQRAERTWKSYYRIKTKKVAKKGKYIIFLLIIRNILIMFMKIGL